MAGSREQLQKNKTLLRPENTNGSTNCTTEVARDLRDGALASSNTGYPMASDYECAGSSPMKTFG